MYDYTQDNLSISTTCPACLTLDAQCAECLESAEARASDIAHEIVDEQNEIYPRQWLNNRPQPSASDWVASEQYISKARKVVKQVEEWDDECHLVELTVKFLDPKEEYETRHEFLPPIAQLIDGGELDNLWELDDETQAKRETECQWCHILTPRLYNDCQSCDLPLEVNVR